MRQCFLFTLFTIITQTVFAADCSNDSLTRAINNLEIKQPDRASLPLSIYRSIETLMICDLDKKLSKENEKVALRKIQSLKSKKPTPFAWADRQGVHFWEDEVKKMGIIPKELRNSLPIILSQLNSAVVTFVPSENEDNTTSYKFEVDLKIDLFSPWDKGGCVQGHEGHEHTRRASRASAK